MVEMLNAGKRPLRVLQCFVNLNRGGAESMVMNYYRAMDLRRVQFDFMVHRQERGLFEDEIESMGGRIYRMPAIHPRTILAYQRALREFFMEHPEYSIIHGHFSELGYFAYKAAAKAGVPVRISHAHNTTHGFDLKALPRHLLRWAGRPFVTHPFACSRAAGEWFFGRNADYQLMPNAIDSAKFSFDPERRSALRAQMGISETALVLGHVGRFDLQKNHSRLLEIFQECCCVHPGAHLLLVGDGALRGTMEAKASSLGISSRVQFLGNRADIPDLMQIMDIFLFPSLFEGLPVTVIEAQAAGLPCVISDAITREVDVSGQVEFLPLAANNAHWAGIIGKVGERDRIPDAATKVSQGGYDIHSNAVWLMDAYLKLAWGRS